MTSTLDTDAIGTPGHRGLGNGLLVFIWLLPIHIFVMAFLFGGLGWPAPTVRAIAAWKELLVAVLFGLTFLRVARRPGANLAVHWLDLAVGGLGALALAYLIGAGVWFDARLPFAAQLYGFRDVAVLCLLYLVGRGTPQVAEDPGFLRVIFVVGVATSIVAILERLFVTPEALVLLGASRYLQEFLGVATGSSVYGLPDNYFTLMGSHIVRRAGSTYMSGQGFAIPFLVVLPAATLWLLSSGRRRFVAWMGYGLLWVGLLLSITRMTIVACLLQTLLIAIARRRWGLTVGLGFAFLGGLAAGLALVPGLASYVWDTLTWQTGSSLSHLTDWSRAFQNLLRYPLGVGLGATDIIAARFGVAPLAGDNQYFNYAVQLGLLGLALHVAVLAGIVAAGARAFGSAATGTGRSYGLLVAAVGVGVALNALTAGVFNSQFVGYVFFWLAGSVVTLLDRRPAAETVRT